MKTLPHPGPPTVGEGKVGGIFVAEYAKTAKDNRILENPGDSAVQNFPGLLLYSHL